MNVKYFSIVSLILGTCLVTVSFKNSIGSMNDLIPREVLFGNPERAAARISPDGTRISYLANGQTPETKNVLNIWVMPVEGGDARQVTFDTSKGIHDYFWRYNSEEIFYQQDADGDENWQIFGVSLGDLDTREYTPAGSFASMIAYSKLHPDRMLVAINEDNPAVHDVFEIDLQSGERKLVEKNPGAFDSWYADHDLHVRAAYEGNKDGYALFFKENGEWQLHIKYEHGEHRTLGFFGFNKEGAVAYFRDALGSDTAQVIEYTIKDRSRKVILSCPIHDVVSEVLSPAFLYNEDTDTIEAIGYDKERVCWHIFDPACQKAFNTIGKAHPGDPNIVSRSLDRSKWIVSYENDVSPISYYLYDAELDTTQFLFSSRPALGQYQLAPMKPISFHVRDGLLIHGYLTLPVNKAPEKLPLVLFVHGGPNWRDSWGLYPTVQWLANRGYAVLQVNYRGSTGYGKKFVEACCGEWGRKMHYDLLDSVQWAIDENIADPKRVAVYGGSYGGYAALCGATFSPDAFACAIDVVGISNLESFITTVPPYWDVELAWWHKMIGHPEHDKELLAARSPLTHVDKITIPVLIAQGANDPRVKQAESEQIVAAMKEKGISHEYLLFANEGHGFRRPENKIIFYAAAEKFLAKHLGGLCQP